MTDRVRVVSGVRPLSTSFAAPTITPPGSTPDPVFDVRNRVPGHIAVPGSSATESFVDVTFVLPPGYEELMTADPIVEWEVELREGVTAPLYFRSFSSPVRCGPLKGGATYTVRARGITRSGVTTAWSTPTEVSALRDAVAPGTVTGLQATPAYTSIIVTWAEVADADVKDGLGQYDVQLANDAAFTTNTKIQRVKGTIFGWLGLTTGTAYYVRVRAVDYSGNVGQWSAGVSATPGTVPLNTIGGATGAFDNLAVFNLAAVNAMFADASISNAKIVDLSVNKLQADSVLAKRVMIGGGLNGILQSENYVAGSAGWAIKGDGSAEFSNVTVRGTITTGASNYTGPRIELRAADLNFLRLYTGHPAETTFGFLRVDIWGAPSTASLELQPPVLTGAQYRPYLRLTSQYSTWLGRAELGTSSALVATHIDVDPTQIGFVVSSYSALSINEGWTQMMQPLFMNDQPIRLRSRPDVNHGIWYNSAIDGPEVDGWNSVRIHLVFWGNSFDFEGDGYARASGGWTTFSSRRIKSDIEDIEAGALERVKALRPRRYKLNGQEQFGFVAEEMAEAEPTVVVYDRKGDAQAIDYGRLSTLAIAAVQELMAEFRDSRRVLRTDTKEAITKLRAARDDIAAIRDDIQAIKADVRDHRRDIRALENRVTALEAP